MRGSRPPTRPTRPRWPSAGALAAASWSRVRRSAWRASSRPGTGAGARLRLRRPLAGAAAPAGGAGRPLRRPGGAALRAGPTAARPLDVAFEWLAARAEGVEELRAADYGAPAGAVALARGAFSARSQPPPAPDGAVRLVEAAGTDGEASAVAAEVCRLLRLGLGADEVLVVTPDGYDCEPRRPPSSVRACPSPSTCASASPTCPPARRCAASAAWPGRTGIETTSSRGCARRARAGRLPGLTSPRPGCAVATSPTASARSASWRPTIRPPGARAGGAARRQRPGGGVAHRGRCGARSRLRDSPALAETRAAVAARRGLAAASALADELSAALPGNDGDDVLAALDAAQVRLGDGLPAGRVRIVRLGVARLAPLRALVLCGLRRACCREPPPRPRAPSSCAAP